MTIGDKIRAARLSLNLSQMELAEMADISERSMYNYEQAGAIPRASILKRLAEVLGVTVAYLMSDEQADKTKNIDEELFLANAKNEFGAKGAKEAKAVLDKASALFAGGDLDDEAKEIFFQSLMEVYMQSKAEAREKFAPGRRKSRKA